MIVIPSYWENSLIADTVSRCGRFAPGGAGKPQMLLQTAGSSAQERTRSPT
jgi:hypothetical protein